MRTERRSRITGTFLLAVVLASAGCVGVLGPGPGGGATSEGLPDGEEAVEAYRSIEGVEGKTVVVSKSAAGTSRSRRLDRRIPGTRMRYERFLSGSLAGTVVASNGSVVWYYDPGANTVSTWSAGSRWKPIDHDGMIRETFSVLQVEGTTTTTMPVSAAPTVPERGGSTRAGRISEDNVTYRIRYNGTDSVAGRDTYVVEYYELPDERDAGRANSTVWYDAENFYPLKWRVTYRNGTDRSTFRYQYTNVTFDPGLNERSFRPDLPANVTVED